MMRLFGIATLGLLGWAVYSNMANLTQDAAIRQEINLRNAQIDQLKAAPSYKRLIERGTEKCPGQTDHIIWVCGATIRMPQNDFPDSAARRNCSSPEEPQYVGSFPLPRVTSAELETAGQQVRVSIPNSVTLKGRYREGGFWRLYIDELPEFEPCDVRNGRECADLWISGERELVSEDAYFYSAVPDVLEQNRLAPETIDYENHSLEDDVFLDLDGRPVAHAVGYPSSKGRHVCRFRLLHPVDGYVIRLRLACDQVGDWRELLRGVLAEMSNRKIDVVPGAQCEVPPENARIVPKAGRSLDQHQAMHDWVAARSPE